MPSNNWDEARNFEVAMLFAVIEILKNGGKMADFEGVAAKLGEGFTEASVRFVCVCLILSDATVFFIHQPQLRYPTFLLPASSNFSPSHTSSLPPTHSQEYAEL